jgi:hypothetical protein
MYFYAALVGIDFLKFLDFFRFWRKFTGENGSILFTSND